MARVVDGAVVESGWQAVEGGEERVADVLGRALGGQVQEHDVAGPAADLGVDG